MTPRTSTLADASVRELDAFTTTPCERVKVADVKECAEFQARDLGLVYGGHVAASERERADLIATIRRDLEADAAHDSPPVWIADIDGALCVVDGFHRTRAYKLAGRDTIRACVRKMPHGVALAVALLVNRDDRKVPLTAGERAEAAWQFLAIVTDRGTHSARSRGWTQARFTRQCGIHRNQTGKMHKAMQRMACIDPVEFTAHDLNPRTGWITWKAARTYGRTFTAPREEFTSVEEHIIETIRRKAGATVGKFTAWSAQHPARCVDEALRRLAEETAADAPEALQVANLIDQLRGTPGEPEAEF